MAEVFKPTNAAETVAARVCNRAGYGNPLVLIALAGLLLQLVQFWLNNCRAERRTLAKRLRRLTFLQRAAIRNKAHELFAAHPNADVRAAEHDVCEAMFAEATELTEAEAEQVVACALEPFA